MTTTFLKDVDDEKKGIPFNERGGMAPLRERICPGY
jgi:hypothetical protein